MKDIIWWLIVGTGGAAIALGLMSELLVAPGERWAKRNPKAFAELVETDEKQYLAEGGV